jgi:hypothetical protein
VYYRVRGGGGGLATVTHPGGDAPGEVVPEPADRLPGDVAVQPPAHERPGVGAERDVVQRLAGQRDQRPSEQDETRDHQQLGAVPGPERGRAGGGEHVDQASGVPDEPHLDRGTQDRRDDGGDHDRAQRPQLLPQEPPDAGGGGSGRYRPGRDRWAGA